MKKRLQIVEVYWHDISGYGSEWRTVEDLESMVHTECHTVGYKWATKKTKEGSTNLVIVGTVTDDAGVGDVNVIPEGCVRQVKVLATVTVEMHKPS